MFFTNRRRFPRYTLKGEITLLLDDKRFVFDEACNISLGGMCLLVHKNYTMIEDGTPGVLHMVQPCGREVIKFSTDFVKVWEELLSREPLYKIGIEFVNINVKAFERLSMIVNYNARKEEELSQ